MIQRIQSLYLAIAAFLVAFLFSNPIAEIVVSDNLYVTLWHNRIISANEEAFATRSTLAMTILLSVIILIELITIMLYKKRQLQIRLCIFNLLLMFGLVGLIFFFTRYTLADLNGIKSVFLWPIVCPMIAAILNYLAIKAIRKDEKLVRSYDRIR